MTVLLALVLLGVILGPANDAFAARHAVSEGESLYKIAQRYHTSVGTLQRANSLEGTKIFPGQVLWVPRYHFVSPGESLYLIGKKYGLHYSEIMRHNNLDSATVYPGQKLYIPDVDKTVSRGGFSLSRAEMDLLARLITAEADSESFLTKVAVGAVVLNRVLSDSFPDTVAGVIYQVDEKGYYQFEPVLNGWINRPASPEAILAAREAVNGWDPSKDSLYFWESWVENSFLNSRPVSIILDAFTFTW